VLERQPLNYRVQRQSGSHRTMVSPRYPILHLAFHESATLPPGLVRKIMTKDVGLTDEEALNLIR
jgi:predicted RNA binding protein YcfA (HicA-like mRNA interferase family)